MNYAYATNFSENIKLLKKEIWIGLIIYQILEVGSILEGIMMNCFRV